MSQSPSLIQPTPTLTSHSTLGSDIVDIYVGPLRKHFEVHEELLCQDVPVFNTMFKSGFMEGLKKSADFPEDDSETFDTFIQWLYDDELDEIKIDKERPWSEPLLGRMKLFIFAEKHCIDVLADYAIDTILLASEDWGERDFTQPTLEVVQLVYENTLPGSGLRLYLAMCSAICYQCCKWGPSEREIQHYITGGNASNMRELLSEFMTDMSDQWIDHPNRAPICAYHRHEGEKNCFTRSREEALLEDN